MCARVDSYGVRGLNNLARPTFSLGREMTEITSQKQIGHLVEYLVNNWSKVSKNLEKKCQLLVTIMFNLKV